MATNISRRGSVYYVRVAVPRDLMESVGRREIWQSLRTKDATEARRLARAALGRLDEQWRSLRDRREVTRDDVETLIWQRYADILEADDRWRSTLPAEEDLDVIYRMLESEFGEDDIAAYRIFSLIKDEFDTAREDRERRLLTLRSDAARGQAKSVAEVVATALKHAGLKVSSRSSARDLELGLQRAEIEALVRTGERDQGLFGGSPTDPLVKPPSSRRSPKAAPGEAVLELWERFKREKEGSVTEDTWRQNKIVIRLFAEFVGCDADVRTAVTRRAIRDWKNALFIWPRRVGDTAAFKGMQFHKVLETNEKLGKPPILPKTINRYLSALGAFASWLEVNEFIDRDVMKGQFLELDKSERKVLPYTSADLDAIFSSPLFTSSRGDGKEHLSGDINIRDWRFWLPILALFSGARLGELAQMHISDIRQVHGVWVLHVTAEGGGKSVKTKGSERVIPLHPEIERLGFLDYRAQMVMAGEKQLFPTLKPDTRGFWSGHPSRFLNLYMHKVGVKIDRSKNVHSFRHGIADAFRRAGFLDEQFAPLLGHTKASTTQRYGILTEGNLAMRKMMIDAVEFPGLKISPA